MKIYYLIFPLLLFPLAEAVALEFKVAYVVDGDTITLQDQNKNLHKIQIAGIDAPEKSQPAWRRAKEGLSEKLQDKVVTVNKTTISFRSQIFLNGEDVGLWQLTRGRAWVDRNASEQLLAADLKKYQQAQLNAQQKRIGLWQLKEAIPPWEYKLRNRP